MSMHGKEAPPPIDERYRIPLRVAVIIGAYALYFFLGDTDTMGSIFVGLGTLLIGLALVDRWTLRRDKRSGLLQVGMTILGLGLLGLGISYLLA